MKGKALGKCVPIGYKVGPDQTYEIDPEGAKIVKLIFKLYLEGKTQIEIVNFLNSKNYKTTTGGAFNKNSLPRILSNTKYIGIYSAAGVTIEGGIPAIIDANTFALAQRMRAQRAVARPKSSVKATYLLSQKLYCAYCGKPLNGVSGTSKTGAKHFYYYCPTMRKKGNCQKSHISKSYIEDLAVDLTVKYVLKADVLEACVDKMLAIQSKLDDREEKIKQTKKMLNENKKAQNGLLKALEQGLGTAPILRRLDELEKERLNLEGELAYHKTKQFGLTKDQMLFFLEKFLDDTGKDDAQFNESIIRTFINKIIISNDKIEIYYNLSDNDGASQTLESALSVRPVPRKVDLTSPQVELYITGQFIYLNYTLK